MIDAKYGANYQIFALMCLNLRGKKPPNTKCFIREYSGEKCDLADICFVLGVQHCLYFDKRLDLI